MKGSRKIQVALIGAGRIADVHREALIRLGARADLAAFCDERAETVVEREAAWRVPGFTSIAKLLERVPCDAVIVLLPHDAHRQAVAAAAQAGKAILLEKPLAANLEDARAIIACCRQAGVPLMVGHNGLFHPTFEKMLKLVRSGAIGRPLFGQAKSAQWLDFRPWDFRRSVAKTGGGCWIDGAGHMVYRLREIFGAVTEVRGFAGNLARSEMEGEDFAAAVLRYREGALAQITVSYGIKLPGYEQGWPRGCDESLVVSGDRGTIKYTICPQPGIRMFSDLEGIRSPVHGWISDDAAVPFEESFFRQMSHFLECLETGRPPHVSGEDALETLEILTAFYSAQPFAKEGSPPPQNKIPQ